MQEGNDVPGKAGLCRAESARGTTEWKGDRTGFRPPGVPFFFFGVALPLLAIGVEISTGTCAAEFFDPIPSTWHAVVVTLVPLVNLAVWLVVRRQLTWNPRLLGLANGFAIGAASYYTLLFLPLLPAALFGVIFLIGLLPMAPLFSLVAALRGRLHLKRYQRQKGVTNLPGLIPGLAVFLLVMVSIDAQSALTRIGLKMAASDEHEQIVQGIRLLRAFGNEDLLVRACYKRMGLATDLIGVLICAGDPVPPGKAREIYYRVTGVPFNSVPLPHGLNLRRLHFPRDLFDAGLGGDSVAGRVQGLRLSSSRIDGSVDPDAALAYVEWTLEFRNDSIGQREARAQIQLPPGGVVSRLTLWIDGEEREAAFAGRDRVSKAYKAVVRKKRDPVLVTTQGPDRVSLQCFPVPSHGGLMKTRIGITAPLILVTRQEGYLPLPQFLERNFSLGPDSKHLVWIESRREVQSVEGALAQKDASSKVYALRGALSDAELSGKSGVVRVQRSEAVERAWTLDNAGNGEAVVLQTIATKKRDLPQSVVFVVDGSASMRRYTGHIVKAVAQLPTGLDCTVLAASDEVIEVAKDLASGHPELRTLLNRRLNELEFLGGCDNVPALEKAWEIAAAKPGSVIVWIHGPQPIVMRSPLELEHNLERRPDAAILFEASVAPDVNRIVERLGLQPSVRSVPRLGDLKDDLERLFSRWGPQGGEIFQLRQRITREALDSEPQPPKETSSHLARLWANDRITELLHARGKKGAATELAVRYRLVTPVTGAVVLENADQYAQAGLTPPSAEGVPTIPEPETYLLIIVALAGLAWLVRGGRQKWQTT